MSFQNTKLKNINSYLRKSNETKLNGPSPIVENTETGDDEIEILYNEPDIRSLISGKAVGTFLIHKGPANADDRPYTIYAIKASTSSGKPMVISSTVLYDPDCKTFSIGYSRGPSYPSLRALIDGQKENLKYHYIKPVWMNNPNYSVFTTMSVNSMIKAVKSGL